MTVDLLLGRLDFLEQLLEQRIVKIGELFDQIGPGGAFLIPKTIRQLDQIRRLARPIVVSALTDQVDVAGDF